MGFLRRYRLVGNATDYTKCSTVGETEYTCRLTQFKQQTDNCKPNQGLNTTLNVNVHTCSRQYNGLSVNARDGITYA